jgi:hypothetical protein
MGNITSKNPIYIDTAELITAAPLWIQKILLVPAAAADVATLTYTSEGTTVKFASMKSQATRAMGHELDFGPEGIHVPNLTVATLSNNAVLYIYLV